MVDGFAGREEGETILTVEAGPFYDVAPAPY